MEASVDYLETLRVIKSSRQLTEYFKTVTGKEIACATEADVRMFFASHAASRETPTVNHAFPPPDPSQFPVA